MSRAVKLVIVFVLSALVAGLVATGCATHFIGPAKIVNGRYGCHDLCRRWRMDMVGMVAMGHYSTGCICQVRGRRISEAVKSGAATFAGAACAGVAMQTRRHQEQQQRQQR